MDFDAEKLFVDRTDGFNWNEVEIIGPKPKRLLSRAQVITVQKAFETLDMSLVDLALLFGEVFVKQASVELYLQHGEQAVQRLNRLLGCQTIEHLGKT